MGSLGICAQPAQKSFKFPRRMHPGWLTGVWHRVPFLCTCRVTVGVRRAFSIPVHKTSSSATSKSPSHHLREATRTPTSWFGRHVGICGLGRFPLRESGTSAAYSVQRPESGRLSGKGSREPEAAFESNLEMSVWEFGTVHRVSSCGAELRNVSARSGPECPDRRNANLNPARTCDTFVSRRLIFRSKSP